MSGKILPLDVLHKIIEAEYSPDLSEAEKQVCESWRRMFSAPQKPWVEHSQPREEL